MRVEGLSTMAERSRRDQGSKTCTIRTIYALFGIRHRHVLCIPIPQWRSTKVLGAPTWPTISSAQSPNKFGYGRNR